VNVRYSKSAATGSKRILTSANIYTKLSQRRKDPDRDSNSQKNKSNGNAEQLTESRNPASSRIKPQTATELERERSIRNRKREERLKELRMREARALEEQIKREELDKEQEVRLMMMMTKSQYGQLAL
jgi:hypothetical protein